MASRLKEASEEEADSNILICAKLTHAQKGKAATWVIQ